MTETGPVILGFADGGKEHFAGHIMDPEQITVGPDGHLAVTPARKAAE